MSSEEAAERYCFDDQLFSRNSAGLWEGKSTGQTFLGQAADIASTPLGYGDDRHICLICGSRGGKGAGVIVPNLCLWPGSAIVIDPKGENATITAQRRGAGSAYTHGMGQTVRILDPFNEVQLDPSLKARFNPLDAIDLKGQFAVDDAGSIAAALVLIQNQKEPFWELAARNLIKGLILHVKTDPDFKGRENLVSVWKLIMQGNWIAKDILDAVGLRKPPVTDDNKKSTPDAERKKSPSAFSLLWASMKRNKAFNGLIAGIGEQFDSMADRTRDTILKTAHAYIEFLDSEPMQRLLETSDFHLSELKTAPNGLTVYLTLPARHTDTHYGWLRLIISLAVGAMEKHKAPPATGHPTLFVLDEFAGLKRMEVIENAAAQAAGFGVKFLFVVQNIGQFETVYEKNWETFIGNSGLKILFSLDDDRTRSYLSRHLGDREVSRETHSGSEAAGTSRAVGMSATDGHSSSTTRGMSETTTTGTTSGMTDGRTVGTTTGRTSGRNSGFSFGGNGLAGLGGSSSNSNSWGRSLAESFSRSLSQSISRSLSNSESHSTSYSNSSTSSRNYSETRSLTDTHSLTKTNGWGEAIHKRALLNPDEIGRLLARIDDPADDAYPGLVAVLLPGQQPILVRRINYFESPKFAGFFDPHPLYSPPPTLPELSVLEAKRQANELAEEEEAKRRAEEDRLKADQRARDLANWEAQNAAWGRAIDEVLSFAADRRLLLLFSSFSTAALIGLLVLAVFMLVLPPIGWWLIGAGSATILLGWWGFTFWLVSTRAALLPAIPAVPAVPVIQWSDLPSRNHDWRPIDDLVASRLQRRPNPAPFGSAHQ